VRAAAGQLGWRSVFDDTVPAIDVQQWIISPSPIVKKVA